MTMGFHVAVNNHLKLHMFVNGNLENLNNHYDGILGRPTDRYDSSVRLLSKWGHLIMSEYCYSEYDTRYYYHMCWLVAYVMYYIMF